MLTVEFYKSNILNEDTMETLEEFHKEVKNRTNTNNIDTTCQVFWTVLAEQPLHIQFRIIRLGLEKYKKPIIHKYTKIIPPPTNNLKHDIPKTPPKSKKKWFSWLVGMFFN